MQKENFGDKLQILRKLIGLSQKEFSELLNIPQPSLSGYENGRTSPTMEVLIRIAEKCNVSLDWLCGLSSCLSSISTAGDFAAFCYNIAELNEVDVNFEVFDRVDIETEDSKNYAKITFLWNRKGYPSNTTFCSIIRSVEEHYSELKTYLLSKERYDIEKERTVEYYSRLPLTKKHFPELTYDEIIKRRRESLENSIAIASSLFDKEETRIIIGAVQGMNIRHFTRQFFLDKLYFLQNITEDKDRKTFIKYLYEKMERLSDREWRVFTLRIPYDYPYSGAYVDDDFLPDI